MPQLAFTPENVTNQQGDITRLKLKLNERKRIVCVEDPTYAYVHTLRAPKILNGVAVKEEKNRNDGTKFVDYARDFIGRPLCLGDLGTIADKGLDTANCPACARSAETDQVLPPERRFAMPVIVYRTKPGGFEIATPFSVDLVVWAFTDMVFNRLVAFTTEWGSLRNHDLLLGPCTAENYQKFEIMVAKDAAYRADDRRAQLVAETIKENRPANLEAACGRKAERHWMQQDIDKITERWHIANGTAPAADASAATTGTLADGMADLLGSDPGAAPDFSNLLGSTPAPAAPQDVPPPGKDDEGPLDFSRLLAGM